MGRRRLHAGSKILVLPWRQVQEQAVSQLRPGQPEDKLHAAALCQQILLMLHCGKCKIWRESTATDTFNDVLTL